MARATARQTILAAVVFAFALMSQNTDASVIYKPCDGVADVLFVLDSSSSISASDYTLLKDFAADITTSFTIGPNDMQFAALVYSTTFSNEIGFTDYLSSGPLATAIRGLPRFAGLTYTGAALGSARTFSFTAANGARNNVPRIAIVITDGFSTNGTDTETEALLLKMSGVSVIAIGVGSNVDQDELKVIASSDNLVFQVNDFSVLQAIKNDIANSICEEEKKIDPTCINSCVGKTDGDYAACSPLCQQGYFYSCVNQYTYTMPCALGWYTDSNNRRFLARMVYNPVTRQCELNPPNCPRDPIDYEVPPTDPWYSNHTFNGGNQCLNRWDSCYGRPDGNYPICGPQCKTGFYIACSGGESYEMPCALGWYVDSNNNRYTARMVYNPYTDSCELNTNDCPRENPQEWCGTSNPHSDYGYGTGVVTKPCNGKADILFVLDSSGSIGQQNFQILTTFAADLTLSFTVGPNDVQFSAIAFSDDANNEFNFNTYNNGPDVRTALKNVGYIGRTTNTAAALTIASIFSFSALNGARQGVGRAVIVVTDGVSNDPAATAAAANQLKSSGVTVLAVGIGSFVQQSELEAIATSSAHVFMVSSFNGLNLIMDALVTTACDDDNGSTCISNSCKGRSDGDYPACSPECKDGFYYSSVNGFCYKRTCPLGYYVDNNGRRFTAPLVFDPKLRRCELSVASCPRDPTNHEVIPPPYTEPIHQNPYNPTCIGRRESCRGKQNGNYPMCYPDCQSGYYVSCSNDETYEMPCPLGWYTDNQGRRFTAKMVYNPMTDSCELQADYCPRTVTYQETTTVPTTTPYYHVTSTTPRVIQCDDKADLLFILDSSGSIGTINFNALKAFVGDITTHFTLGPDKIQISSMYFSSSAFIDFDFNEFTTNTAVQQAILGTTYLAGTTDTAGALELARTTAFTAANGARPATSKIAVVVTDGVSNDPAATEIQADELKRSGVTVIVIAVGAFVRQSELEAIATSTNHIFMVDNFAVLDTIRDSVVTTTCQGGGCISGSCYGKADGSYPACDLEECAYGHYYVCSSGNAYRETCGLGWYQDSQGKWFTVPRVYDPDTGSCQQSSSSCPRNPEDCREDEDI